MCHLTDQINTRSRENYNRITKERKDMSLKEHNESQACEIQKLIEREKWYLSETLGYDCTTTATGLCMLNNRISYIVTSGFGQFMSDLDTTKDI